MSTIYFFDIIGEVVEWSNQVSLTKEMTFINQNIYLNVDRKKNKKQLLVLPKLVPTGDKKNKICDDV